MSSAKPDVAAYHFTTLTPVLGVVSVRPGESFIMADIPGLIEGAGEGVGLGHAFLRHVERSNILIHVLDAAGSEGRDPKEDFKAINAELKKYSEKLSKKKQLIALNKIDLIQNPKQLDELKTYFTDLGYEVFPVNALSGEGLPALIERACYYVQIMCLIQKLRMMSSSMKLRRMLTLLLVVVMMRLILLQVHVLKS